MSKEQLQEIAGALNVKNVKKLDQEHLAYAILDAEAKEASLKPVEKKPARRGRPRKEDAAAKNITTVPAEAGEEAPEAAQQPKQKAPARRGRKPKAETAPQAEAPKTEAAVTGHKSPDAKDAEAKASGQPQEKPASRRGRKPKAVPQAESEAIPASPAATPALTEEQRREKIEQNAQKIIQNARERQLRKEQNAQEHQAPKQPQQQHPKPKAPVKGSIIH